MTKPTIPQAAIAKGIKAFEKYDKKNVAVSESYGSHVNGCMKAALEAAAPHIIEEYEASLWQPIDECPIDKTVILLLGGVVGIGNFFFSKDHLAIEFSKDHLAIEDGVLCVRVFSNHNGDCFVDTVAESNVTHFRPLPQPKGE